MAKKATFIVKADISQAVFNCLRQLDSYDKRTSDSIRKIVKDSTESVFAGAVQRVPARTGALKKSIRMRFEDTPTNTVGVVYTKEPTAHLVENGAGPVPILPSRGLGLLFYPGQHPCEEGKAFYETSYGR